MVEASYGLDRAPLLPFLQHEGPDNIAVLLLTYTCADCCFDLLVKGVSQILAMSVTNQPPAPRAIMVSVSLTGQENFFMFFN